MPTLVQAIGVFSRLLGGFQRFLILRDGVRYQGHGGDPDGDGGGPEKKVPLASHRGSR